MSEFKAGDKVRGPRGTTGNVLIADPDADGRLVVVDDDDGCYWFCSPRLLTLIPDTVTVTVELPRDEATAVSHSWTQRFDTYPSLAHAGAARFAEKIREALQ